MTLSFEFLYKLFTSFVIPQRVYSSAIASAIICFVSSFTSWLLVLPLAIVSKACVTSSTLFSILNIFLSLPVISSLNVSISTSNKFIIVFELGLIVTFIPPSASATTPYSPSASKAKLSIPINTDDLAVKVFIVTPLPAPDFPNITIL